MKKTLLPYSLRRLALLLLFVIPVALPAWSATLAGDVDGDGEVSIADVANLIDYLLTDDATGVNLQNADVNRDGLVDIADVADLIDYLLKGSWPEAEHEWVPASPRISVTSSPGARLLPRIHIMGLPTSGVTAISTH